MNPFAITGSAVSALFVATSALAQVAGDAGSLVPVVVTQAEGIVTRPPDRAWVTIAVESQAANPREAQQRNAKSMSIVTEKLKNLRLAADALQTTAYDVQPEYDFHDGKRVLRGYVARSALEVRVDAIERLGEVIERGVTAGATAVNGVRFDLRDRAATEREALRQAVVAARARADAIALAAGGRVTRIIRVEEEAPVSIPRPVMMRSMTAERASRDEPPIAPGLLEVTARATLTAEMSIAPSTHGTRKDGG